ncbi:MAG: aminotransferase class V-fold PLP-dependent enzyme, partial [Verrucomicrobiota bacterium]
GLMGYVRAQGKKCRVVTTAIEHPSILGACDALADTGHEIIRLEVDSTGFVLPDAVVDVLKPGDLLVTHLANYDIGTRQALSELGQIARNVKAVFMVDATFGAGWNEFSMQSVGADIVTLAPHRFFGPAGVGVLIVGPGVELKPLYFGGAQEYGWRPGSQSVANIVGSGAACSEAMLNGEAWRESTAQSRCDFVRLLEDKLSEFQLNGASLDAGRDPHHLSISIRGVEGEAVLLNLDLKGVAVTSNTGCVTAADKISPVLKVIGVELELATGTLVIGLLPEHSSGDMTRAVDLLVSAVERIRSMSQSWHQFDSERAE